MKKLLILLAMLMATSAYAADTCTITGGAATHPINPKSGFYDYALACVADASGNFQYTLTATEMSRLSGQFAYTIASNGSNTVSDGAELEIRDSYGLVYLDAAGNGNDFLDTSTATWEYFSGPGTDHYPAFTNRYPITIYAENIGGAGNIFIRITTMDAK